VRSLSSCLIGLWAPTGLTSIMSVHLKSASLGAWLGDWTSGRDLGPQTPRTCGRLQPHPIVAPDRGLSGTLFVSPRLPTRWWSSLCIIIRFASFTTCVLGTERTWYGPVHERETAAEERRNHRIGGPPPAGLIVRSCLARVHWLCLLDTASESVFNRCGHETVSGIGEGGAWRCLP
jgi:hypothetical protein